MVDFHDLYVFLVIVLRFSNFFYPFVLFVNFADITGPDNPIPLSPQWLLPKPGETKTGMSLGVCTNISTFCAADVFGCSNELLSSISFAL